MTAQRRGLAFSDAVDRYLDTKLSEFKNAKHAAQWRSTLTTYAIPELGHMPVSDIAVQDVLRVLQPIWHDKTETANRLRGRIEAVLSWATVAGHRTGSNPALWKGNLDALLPKPGRVAKKSNHPAVALSDAGAWFGALRQREGMAARALEFLALTASRSQEVRGARWEEINLEDALWTVPAHRMKMEREHLVPLPEKAMVLLSRLPRIQGSPSVFPAPRGGELSDMSLSAVMKRMHATELAAGRTGWLDKRNRRPAVPHGLRSTFRDWAAENAYAREMAEIALAHRVGSEVERSYLRTDLLESRRDMMQAWSEFLSR